MKNFSNRKALIITLGSLGAAFTLSSCVGGTSSPLANGSLQTSSDNSTAATQYMYVANSGNSTISMYKIESGGNLSQLQSSPVYTGLFTIGDIPSKFTVDPSNQYVYFPNNVSGNISMYKIDKTSGILEALPALAVKAGIGVEDLVFAPSGNYAYASNFSDNTVSIYKFDNTTGNLNLLNSISTEANPRNIVISKSGKCAYVPTFRSNTIDIFNIDTDSGALSFINSVPTGSNPENLVITPTEQFAYVPNFDSSTISMYSINKDTCQLTSLSTATVTTKLSGNGGRNPYILTLDPSGKYLYASNLYTDHGGSNVVMYSINPQTGELNTLATPYISLGNFPRGVAFEPSGKFAYIQNYNSSNRDGYSSQISMYSFDAASGILSPIIESGVPMTFSSHYMAFEHTGKFAYVTNPVTNSITVYGINPTTGLLNRLTDTISDNYQALPNVILTVSM